jgi:hypothetical protein
MARALQAGLGELVGRREMSMSLDGRPWDEVDGPSLASCAAGL